MASCVVAILSDIHYAGAAERARGDDYEYRDLKNPFLRFFVSNYRHFIWLRHPLQHGHLLDRFINGVESPDLVIANGDYSCDTGFVGLSDAAACESARECLTKLRDRFAPNFHASIGDHELGKASFVGAHGGMRLASWQRCLDLVLEPFWRIERCGYAIIGVTSSLLALPVFEPDTLPAELDQWRKLREEHLAEIRSGFAAIKRGQRIILFCHDPTALPFLWHDENIRLKIPQVEHTIIGHLHTPLVLWKSRVLAGMPPIRSLGHTTKRLTTALSEARTWRHFRVRLCPALAGTQLLKDGGYLTMELNEDPEQPAKIQFHRLPQLARP
jgi:hypothetical protein